MRVLGVGVKDVQLAPRFISSPQHLTSSIIPCQAILTPRHRLRPELNATRWRSTTPPGTHPPRLGVHVRTELMEGALQIEYELYSMDQSKFTGLKVPVFLTGSYIILLPDDGLSGLRGFEIGLEQSKLTSHPPAAADPAPSAPTNVISLIHETAYLVLSLLYYPVIPGYKHTVSAIHAHAHILPTVFPMSSHTLGQSKGSRTSASHGTTDKTATSRNSNDALARYLGQTPGEDGAAYARIVTRASEQTTRQTIAQSEERALDLGKMVDYILKGNTST
ncbi:hypothetical protein V8F06_013544 [Rhypophila decipiens]